MSRYVALCNATVFDNAVTIHASNTRHSPPSNARRWIGSPHWQSSRPPHHCTWPSAARQSVLASLLLVILECSGSMVSFCRKRTRANHSPCRRHLLRGKRDCGKEISAWNEKRQRRRDSWTGTWSRNDREVKLARLAAHQDCRHLIATPDSPYIWRRQVAASFLRVPPMHPALMRSASREKRPFQSCLSTSSGC